MRTDELPEHLEEQWPRIREQLLEGAYEPMPVRRHEVPKSGGGVRQEGIPTVLDRVVQQAILQVLQPIFDPTFSEHSSAGRSTSAWRIRPESSGAWTSGSTVV